jgi:type I restriction enzyme R subunit
MRQAIEEAFIMDVLENYTTFKRYFKLVKTIEAENEVEKCKAGLFSSKK